MVHPYNALKTSYMRKARHERYTSCNSTMKCPEQAMFMAAGSALVVARG